jgi:hypothetical protein
MQILYKATTRTPSGGRVDVLLNREQLVAGFEEQGLDMEQRLRAFRNLEQGLAVFVGPVAIQEFRPLARVSSRTSPAAPRLVELRPAS